MAEDVFPPAVTVIIEPSGPGKESRTIEVEWALYNNIGGQKEGLPCPLVLLGERLKQGPCRKLLTSGGRLPAHVNGGGHPNFPAAFQEAFEVECVKPVRPRLARCAR